MSAMNIGIDIGGTFIKGVVIDKDQVVLKLSKDLPNPQSNWQQAVAELLNELKAQWPEPVSSLGLAAPGITDHDNRTIATMPGRLEGLEHFDWSTFLKEEVLVLNDAHAALYAESQWGVGKGIPNIVMLTLGTGVGGGLLLNGQLYQGFLHRAGHLGHVALEANTGIPDITGISGSLEDAVGEATLQSRSRGRFNTSIDLVKAYQANDTWATYVWLNSVRILALGIASFCNAFSPEMVILGGGISKAGDHLLQPLFSFMDLYEWRPGGQSTPIKLAKLQDYSGAIGAALYADTKL